MTKALQPILKRQVLYFFDEATKAVLAISNELYFLNILEEHAMTITKTTLKLLQGSFNIIKVIENYNLLKYLRQ